MESKPHLNGFLNVAGDLAGDLAYHVIHGPEIGGLQPGITCNVGRLHLSVEAGLIRLGLQIIDAVGRIEIYLVGVVGTP